jgi:hypothetical protein
LLPELLGNPNVVEALTRERYSSSCPRGRPLAGLAAHLIRAANVNKV